MAAGKPIVCADIPPVRDVVSEGVVEFYKPGDIDSLADAIESVLSHPDRVQYDKGFVKKYDWQERQKRLLEAVMN